MARRQATSSHWMRMFALWRESRDFMIQTHLTTVLYAMRRHDTYIRIKMETRIDCGCTDTTCLLGGLQPEIAISRFSIG